MPDNAASTILLTRPRAASERFAAALQSEIDPVNVVIAPLMETRARELVPTLAPDAMPIFTSAAGVDAVAGRLSLSGRTAWCVGARTAEAATDLGSNAKSAEGDADALISMIIEAAPKQPLVHLRGAKAAGDIARALAAAGLQVEAHVVYDQVPVPPSDAFLGALTSSVLVPLFSPQSARLFVQCASGHIEGPITIVALSQAVANAIPVQMVDSVHIAQEPNAPALIRAIKSVFLR